MSDLCLVLEKDESFAQAFIREVNNDLADVKRSFIRIGFRLAEAVEFEYYKELGYKNIVELAETEFGFKSTTTYEFIKVYEFAHDPDCRWNIAPVFDKYSYSQLLALSYAKYVGTSFFKIVRPTDSVRKLKCFVSNWNKEYKRGCGYHPECKTVDDYLNLCSKIPQQQSKQIEHEDEFSERSENLPLISNTFCLHAVSAYDCAKLIANLVTSLPDSYGLGMPYESRLIQWLSVRLLAL